MKAPCVLLLSVAMFAALPADASAQWREPDRFGDVQLLRVPPAAIQPVTFAFQQEEKFNYLGFTLLGLAGAAVGGFVGYHVEREFYWSRSDDPGLTGLVVGMLVGGVAGMIVGGQLGH